MVVSVPPAALVTEMAGINVQVLASCVASGGFDRNYYSLGLEDTAAIRH